MAACFAECYLLVSSSDPPPPHEDVHVQDRGVPLSHPFGAAGATPPLYFACVVVHEEVCVCRHLNLNCLPYGVAFFCVRLGCYSLCRTTPRLLASVVAHVDVCVALGRHLPVSCLPLGDDFCVWVSEHPALSSLSLLETTPL